MMFTTSEELTSDGLDLQRPEYERARKMPRGVVRRWRLRLIWSQFAQGWIVEEGLPAETEL